VIVAFDPGKNIGIAFVNEQADLEQQHILTLEQILTYQLPEEAVLVVGNGTGSEAVEQVLKARGLSYTVIDETGTTLEARPLYFKAHPPKGLLRLLPKGMLSPPELIDGYAAYAIALRYLKTTAA